MVICAIFVSKHSNIICILNGNSLCYKNKCKENVLGIRQLCVVKVTSQLYLN